MPELLSARSAHRIRSPHRSLLNGSLLNGSPRQIALDLEMIYKDLKLENFCLEDDSENARIKLLGEDLEKLNSLKGNSKRNRIPAFH